MLDTPSSPPPPSPARPPARPFVLVADPDHRRAALYCHVVESLGLRALATRNGDEAKAMLQRRDVPALLVANLSLPRLDGFSLIAELRRVCGPASPVLAISSSKELIEAARHVQERLGITDVLPGDASEELVRDTLTRLLPAPAPHAAPLTDIRALIQEGRDRWIAETLDRFVAEAARRFDVRFALVSVTILDREWFRIHVNSPPHPVSGRTSPRSWSFIRQVTEAGEPMVAPDVRQHPIFSIETFPPAGTLRGYAGVPVRAEAGIVAGALCLFHTEPLTLDARAIDALSDTANRLALELQSGVERARGEERYTALTRLALTDPITGLANRRGGEAALAREVSRARRSGTPLSLVIFDIDHFKSVNDRAGHAVGDAVLAGISDILSASQRGSDLAIRWGGEEFLVLLPDVGLSGARTFAERVRENAQGLSVREAGPITVSAGVAELRGEEDGPAALARADANLYRAKEAGRNRVVWDDDSPSDPVWLPAQP